MTQLPPEGRKGPPPKWPLTSKATVKELAAWSEVWLTPQAVAWERLGWTRTVGRYVRLLVRSESARAPASIAAEVRQLEDRLGLTPMSMLRLRWEISADEISEHREEKEEAAKDVRRLRAVDAAGK